jgi:pyruvate dehydrogenase E2 component (dihydrolipoamide acetyltransferase)
MATDIKLPELGEGVTEGELVKWLVKPGDSVKADQTVAEIMTDKATVEVPSPVAGTVKELKFKPGQVIKVESVILTLDGAAAATAPAPTKTNGAHPTSTASAPAPAPAAAAPASTSHGKTIEVKLPELGEGVTEGELVKWTVNIGDSVKADQTVAEIMTDKATVEVPSPVAGVVKEFKFKKGEVIKVESVILTLTGTGGGASPQAPQATAHAGVSANAPTQAYTKSAPAATSPSMSASASTGIFPPVADSKVLATPATRRLAREMGVDINGMSGTGLAGRVTREDVISSKGGATSVSTTGAGATSAGTPTMNFPKPAFTSTNAQLEERVDLIGIRKKIAQNLQMSKSIIPHFTLMDEADVSQLEQRSLIFLL